MSFKRDGDDHELLNRLKHQRVADLLGNFIPEDEAKLLSNGRFTCLICLYRPIFDTIKMLSVHRKGKKHLSELSKYIKRKSELEFEAIKKEQQDSINLSNDKDSSMMNVPLLTGVPNVPKDHLSGKFKRKLSDSYRRKTLELPSFINEVQTMSTDIENDLNVVHGPSSASQVRHYLRQLPRKVSFEKVVEMKKENRVSLPKEGTENPTVEKKPIDKLSISKACNKDELSLNLSGWIKDKFGNWVKDPQAEFDSDDDQPPGFPT